MKIAFTETGWEDYLWFQQNDRKRLKRINTFFVGYLDIRAPDKFFRSRSGALKLPHSLLLPSDPTPFALSPSSFAAGSAYSSAASVT